MRWIVSGLVVALSFGLVSSAWGRDIAWEGTLVVIDFDSGVGRFQGGVEGSTVFSGSAHFPDACGATCTIESDPPSATSYRFSDGTGTVQGVGASSLGIASIVTVIDEDVLDEGGVDFAALFGLNLEVGQTIDTWNVSNVTSVTSDIVEWGISYVYITTDPFNDTSFRSTPPPNPDLILWQLIEDGDQYSVVGEVDTVPEPGLAAMWAVGVTALAGLHTHARRGRSRRVV